MKNFRKFIIVFIIPQVLFQNVFGAKDNDWSFCNESTQQAFNNAELTNRKPQADWVCGLRKTDQTTEPEFNGERCVKSQKRECLYGAGGEDTFGSPDHNVPRNAWFIVIARSADVDYVRCQCGCFTGDVNILTNFGNMSIQKLAEKPNRNLRVATVTNVEEGNLKASEVLSKKDFTVGPEAIPVLVIETSAGTIVQMTGTHPVMVAEENSYSMIQAQKLTTDDLLITQNGAKVGIKNITEMLLPNDNNLVYNLDTHGTTAQEHIIVANGLMMGDLVWQKRLSEVASRENLLMYYSQQ